MKNVCYMEYLCREKLLKIFSIYDKELSLHSSNAKKNLISKFITHKRIDAGFYSPLVNNFFSKLDIIGSYILKDLDFSIKRGPNLAKRDLGRSIQTSVANEKYYRLIYPSDISNSGYITKEIYLGTANKIWLLSKGDILFSGEGNVGKTFIICNEMKFTTNFHGIIVRPNFVDNDLTKSIFIGSFLYYMKHIGVMDRLSVGGQGGSFAIQYWDILKFPKISNESLSRIVKLYNSYHDIDLFSFDFEKLNEIGVSQINELRIKCNNLISSILNDLKNNSLKEESDYTV
ncbi:hypothetical protein [Rodentibacter pneumotropicus]|nr:hypothetical protein [Rodentibacter pneumotropicus]